MEKIGLFLPLIPPEKEFLKKLGGNVVYNVSNGRIHRLCLRKYPYNMECLEEVHMLLGLTWLNIFGKKAWDFNQLGEYILKLPQLRVLTISNCGLKEVPNWITDLPNLMNLDLHNNSISEVPESITKLQKLKSISLAGNKFNEIPMILRKLPQL